MADQPDEPVVTEDPERTEDGIALYNGLPVNHGLRAEVLAANGETTDEDGIVSDELIADYAARRTAKKAAPKTKADSATPAAPASKETES